jgi:hypothetical protein
VASSYLRAIAAFTMTVAVASVAACNVSDYQVPKAPEGPGALHLQNGALPAGPVDVWFDDSTPVKVVSSLAFGDTITLTDVSYGTHHLKFSSAGNTDSLAGFPIFISTSRMYTEIVGGDALASGLQLVGGQVSAASVSPSTNAGLRIYNTVDVADYTPTVPDSLWAGNLGISLTGTGGFNVTATGVNEFNALPLLTGGQTAAGFQPLPPNTYTLVVFNSDNPVDTLLKNVSITLRAGELRTATLAGFNPAAPTIRLLPIIVADSGQ